MKEPELKFRARFIVVKNKTVSYIDVPTTTLKSAVVKAKNWNRHPDVTSALVEEYIKGHWSFHSREGGNT